MFSDVRFRGFQDVAGVRIWGFINPTDVRKNPRPPKAAEKVWPFFLVQNQDFSGKMTNFGAFWNFADAKFATFSVLTGVSFGENKISTDVRFRTFFWRQKRTRGEKKKTHALADLASK